MLKRPITYEDFDGNTHTDTFYFNISKPELVELEVEHEDGMNAYIKRIIEAEDNKSLVKEFKALILLAYGEKSADGKQFIKNDQLRDAFQHSAAYSVLFMELAEDADKAADFLKAVLPKDLVQNTDQDKPVGPPPTPAVTDGPSV